MSNYIKILFVYAILASLLYGEEKKDDYLKKIDSFDKVVILSDFDNKVKFYNKVLVIKGNLDKVQQSYLEIMVKGHVAAYDKPPKTILFCFNKIVINGRTQIILAQGDHTSIEVGLAKNQKNIRTIELKAIKNFFNTSDKTQKLKQLK